MLTRQSTDPPTPSSTSSSAATRAKRLSPTSNTGTAAAHFQWLSSPAAPAGNASTARSLSAAGLMQPPPIPGPPAAVEASTSAAHAQISTSAQAAASASASNAQQQQPPPAAAAVAGPSRNTGPSTTSSVFRPSDAFDLDIWRGDLRRATRGSRDSPEPNPPGRRFSPHLHGHPTPLAGELSGTGGERRSGASHSAAGPSRSGNNNDTSDRFIIDLTSSSPPSGRRELVPAARASGLALPGSSTGGTATRQPIGQRRQAGPSAASSSRAELLLSSGEDSDDSDYAPAPVAGPSRAIAGPSNAATSVAAGVRARRRAYRTAGSGSNSDSDIEVVSERPAAAAVAAGPSRYSRYGQPIGSPPPFIVPPGATATTSSTGRAQLRRSTRARNAGAAVPSGAARSSSVEDGDAAYARALANAEAAELGFDDYETAQRSAAAAGTARRGGGGGGRGGSSSRGRGFGGVFGNGGGASPYRDYLSSLLMDGPIGGYISNYLGGGYWQGGGAVHGGAGSLSAAYGGPHYYNYAPGAAGGPIGAVGGWGGAAKVKAASKKYGVRMSHPTPVEKGFSRDIIEPRDPDAPAPVIPAGKKGGRSKASKPTEELEPVCASCLETLLLSGTGDKKVFALRCGHAVCARCLNEAKERCRAIREQEKGGWVADGVEAGKPNGFSSISTAKGKAKGKSRAAAQAAMLDLSEDDFTATGSNSPEVYLSSGSDSDRDFILDGDEPPLPPSKRRRPNGTSTTSTAATASKAKGKGKGKAKSRADETGVEEDWTTCPVASCDGRGTDLLAEEGWARPFEFFT
ncbi:hypothetical protein JCM10908_006726 [Rhodotorula pacifica]|uniref:uncharacterized protein n=1 Tax=Rhodotorula pacifica TaxID=1495444 RepID=UPI003178B422